MVTVLLGLAIGAAFLSLLLGLGSLHQEANPPPPRKPQFDIEMEDKKKGKVYPPSKKG